MRPHWSAATRHAPSVCLLGLSRCVPSVALRLENRGYVETRLTDEEKWHFWANGQLRIGDEFSASGYMRWYVLSQNVDHIRETEIEEFLRTVNKERKHYLGHLLAVLLIDKAVEPFDEHYTEARRKGRLRVWSPSKKMLVAPVSSRDLLKGQLSRGRQIHLLIHDTTARLARRHREELTPVPLTNRGG
jgi:hypothetical protein